MLRLQKLQELFDFYLRLSNKISNEIDLIHDTMHNVAIEADKQSIYTKESYKLIKEYDRCYYMYMEGIESFIKCNDIINSIEKEMNKLEELYGC